MSRDQGDQQNNPITGQRLYSSRIQQGAIYNLNNSSKTSQIMTTQWQNQMLKIFIVYFLCVTSSSISVSASCIQNCTENLCPYSPKICFKFNVLTNYQKNLTICQSQPRCSFSGLLPFKMKNLISDGTCQLSYNDTVFGYLDDKNICQQLYDQLHSTNSLSAGGIAGIVIGSVIVLCLIGYCWKNNGSNFPPPPPPTKVKRRFNCCINRQCKSCGGVGSYQTLVDA